MANFPGPGSIILRRRGENRIDPGSEDESFHIIVGRHSTSSGAALVFRTSSTKIIDLILKSPIGNPLTLLTFTNSAVDVLHMGGPDTVPCFTIVSRTKFSLVPTGVFIFV